MIAVLTRACLLAFLALLGLQSAVVAQCPPPPPTSLLAEGEIGLFFDPFGRLTCGDLAFGVATPLYVVVRVPEGGIAEFDVPEVLTDELPPGLLIFTPDLPPGGPYDPLIVIDGCGRARRSDSTTCPVVQGDLLVISVVEVIALAPISATACFQTACTTIAGVVATPASYIRCDTGAQGVFNGSDVMCIGFGQATVPVESRTWGAVKSVYDD